MKRSVIPACLAVLFSALVATAAVAGKPSRTPKPGGMEVFAAGQSIGWLLDLEDGGGDRVISATGYLFTVVRELGILAGDQYLVFSGTGCTGEAYVSADGNWMPAQGYVFRFSTSVLYVPRGSTPQVRSYASRYEANEWDLTQERCVELTGVMHDSVIALPNDPTITAVSGTSFGAPVVFGVP